VLSLLPAAFGELLAVTCRLVHESCDALNHRYDEFGTDVPRA
jgi:hypothetical protein